MPKAMIISVGGTPAPIIKSICEYKPEFISFFASQDTSDSVALIKSEISKIGLTFKSELTLAENVNDLLHCHEKAEESVQRIIAKGYNKDDVIVDYTGGTKNMSVALALATITYGFYFSYVGARETTEERAGEKKGRTKNGVGIVIDGLEEIYSSINPWDFLAVEERKRIAILFNKYQFKAAMNLINDLVERSTKYKSLFRKLGKIIEGYYNWDLFRHKHAHKCFEDAKLDELIEYDDKSLRTFAKETEKMKEYLKELIDSSNDGKQPCLHSIRDMYANAERRFEEGKIDDAILRIYRIVEMVAQERLLSKYKITTSDVKEKQIPHILREKFIKGYKDQRDGKIKIPQNADFELLNALDDDLGKIFNDNRKRFLDIQGARNNSYLTHGLSFSRERTYSSLRDFIIELKFFKPENVPKFPKITLG